MEERLAGLLAEDLALVRFIDQGSLDGMWLWDLKNPEEEWLSPRFWELLGYAPEEMPHKASSWQKIIFKEDLELAIANYQKVLEAPEEKKYDQEVRYRHKNGSVVHVRCRGKIIFDDNGEPDLMLGAHNDITALKQAQFETQLQKDFYQSIVENQSIYVVKTDLQGNYTYANALFMSTFFKKGESYADRSSIDTIVPEDHQRCMEIVQKCLEQPGIAHKTVLRKPDRNGRIHANEWEFKTLCNIDGVPEEISCIGVSITDLLDANRHLEGLLELYGGYNDRLRQHSYITSHNIRNSVANLMGIVEVLKHEPTNERFLEMLSETSQNLDQTLRNLNDLLNEATDTDRLTNVKSCSVIEPIHRMLTIHQATIANKNIKVSLDIPQELKVEAIPAYYDSICDNLISNALRYGMTDENQSLEITATVKGDFVEINFTDKGAGIPEEELEDIFQMGRQLDSPKEGDGLGLFITRHQARLMGGEIFVYSEVGEGSTFVVSLKKC